MIPYLIEVVLALAWMFSLYALGFGVVFDYEPIIVLGVDGELR